ncbi:hypothetical protein HEK616_79170 (plasmid) [Streptomyces nigrescens]|uniref:Uncharacterized protein n=1 Tax=Streptomyces nigrescens TaxID=1920 RepID=A0ABM8A6T5_STRNI|nr:hypothetical protein [Streptomyces nigrescens]BDM74430.1 hypothetical protein HEK616_79170 [Streptomyces nigrescens]
MAENKNGFDKGDDGALYAAPSQASSVNDYDTWDWKQIEAAITGGAAMADSSDHNRANAVSDPATLVDAGNIFYRVQLVLEMVSKSLDEQATALAGDSGPWRGEAAESFLATMKTFSQQVSAIAGAVSGGSSRLNSVPDQLVRNGNQLAEARAKIAAIDSWYAQQAQIQGVKAMSNGLIPVSKNQTIVNMMTRDMREVLKSLARQYQFTVDAVRPPSSVTPPVKSASPPSPANAPKMPVVGPGGAPSGGGAGLPAAAPSEAPPVQPFTAPGVGPSTAGLPTDASVPAGGGTPLGFPDAPQVGPGPGVAGMPGLDGPGVAGMPGLDRPGVAGMPALDGPGIAGMPSLDGPGAGNTGSAGAPGIDAAPPGLPAMDAAPPTGADAPVLPFPGAPLVGSGLPGMSAPGGNRAGKDAAAASFPGVPGVGSAPGIGALDGSPAGGAGAPAGFPGIPGVGADAPGIGALDGGQAGQVGTPAGFPGAPGVGADAPGIGALDGGRAGQVGTPVGFPGSTGVGSGVPGAGGSAPWLNPAPAPLPVAGGHGAGAAPGVAPFEGSTHVAGPDTAGLPGHGGALTKTGGLGGSALGNPGHVTGSGIGGVGEGAGGAHSAHPTAPHNLHPTAPHVPSFRPDEGAVSGGAMGGGTPAMGSQMPMMPPGMGMMPPHGRADGERSDASGLLTPSGAPWADELDADHDEEIGSPDGAPSGAQTVGGQSEATGTTHSAEESVTAPAATAGGAPLLTGAPARATGGDRSEAAGLLEGATAAWTAEGSAEELPLRPEAGEGVTAAEPDGVAEPTAEGATATAAATEAPEPAAVDADAEQPAQESAVSAAATVAVTTAATATAAGVAATGVAATGVAAAATAAPATPRPAATARVPSAAEATAEATTAHPPRAAQAPRAAAASAPGAVSAAGTAAVTATSTPNPRASTAAEPAPRHPVTSGNPPLPRKAGTAGASASDPAAHGEVDERGDGRTPGVGRPDRVPLPSSTVSTEDVVAWGATASTSLAPLLARSLGRRGRGERADGQAPSTASSDGNPLGTDARSAEAAETDAAAGCGLPSWRRSPVTGGDRGAAAEPPPLRSGSWLGDEEEDEEEDEARAEKAPGSAEPPSTDGDDPESGRIAELLARSAMPWGTKDGDIPGIID